MQPQLTQKRPQLTMPDTVYASVPVYQSGSVPLLTHTHCDSDSLLVSFSTSDFHPNPNQTRRFSCNFIYNVLNTGSCRHVASPSTSISSSSASPPLAGASALSFVDHCTLQWLCLSAIRSQRSQMHKGQRGLHLSIIIPIFSAYKNQLIELPSRAFKIS